MTAQPTWDAEHRLQLEMAARFWLDQGAAVVPVIPVELPADRWPHRNDPTRPRFVGKNPSFWGPDDGNPRLLSWEKYANGSTPPLLLEQLIEYLQPVEVGPAAEFDSPIGLAVITSDTLVCVDLDKPEFTEQLLNRLPGGPCHVETTPKGGLHIWLKPARMDGWRNGRGGFFKSWALEPNKPDTEKLGEVLSLRSVSLVAPTRRSDGRCYAVMTDGQGAETQIVPEIEDLTNCIGIHPTASAAKSKAATKPTKWWSTTTAPKHLDGATMVPHIRTILGKKASEMLAGDLTAYGDPRADRSAVLTAFAREAWGTENWLLDQGLVCEGSADDLIREAVDLLASLDGQNQESIVDKADRVLATIDRDTCDIDQPDKRLERYRYAAGIRVKQVHVKRAPFVVRGLTPEGIVFGVEETGMETFIRSNQLNAQNLRTLAPQQWWFDNYKVATGKYDENDQPIYKIGWVEAAEAILRDRSNYGVYDPGRMRGLGVWLDEGRTVVNCGDYLEVDEKKMSHVEIESQYLYVRRPSCFTPADTGPTEDEINLLDELIRRWNFVDPSGPTILLGWIVAAMLRGALEWGGNIWINSQTDVGKSTLFESIVAPLLASAGGRVFSNDTTAAAIRQILGHDAISVTIDEFESDDEAARRRVEEILRMTRGSSSGEGALVVKGSASGVPLRYLTRSTFAFASIDVNLEKEQDKNRTLIIRLNPLTAESLRLKADTMGKLKLIDSALGGRILRRAIRLLPVIRENAALLEIALSAHRKSHRIALIEGLFLAAALSLRDVGSAVLSPDEVDRQVELFLSGRADSESAAPIEHSDAEECLQHLLLHKVEAVKEVESGIYSRRERVRITVQEALKVIDSRGPYDVEELKRELFNHGLKISPVDGQLCLLVANSHKGAKAIFRDTKWRNHSDTLKRAGADGIPTETQSFGGRMHKHRSVRFRLDALIDEPEARKSPRGKPPSDNAPSNQISSAQRFRAGLQAALQLGQKLESQAAIQPAEAEHSVDEMWAEDVWRIDGSVCASADRWIRQWNKKAGVKS